jgi:hypothetical protein
MLLIKRSFASCQLGRHLWTSAVQRPSRPAWNTLIGAKGNKKMQPPTIALERRQKLRIFAALGNCSNPIKKPVNLASCILP